MNWTQQGTSIRQVRDGDGDAIGEFLGRLSLRTRYLRFFTGAAPSRALLQVLASGHGADVLVAAAGNAIVGHAIAVDEPGPSGLTDIGVVVADEWQGRGVGSALVRALIRRASERGTKGIAMTVLPENQRVLAMIGRHWPGARSAVVADSVTFHASVGGHSAATSARWSRAGSPKAAFRASWGSVEARQGAASGAVARSS